MKFAILVFESEGSYLGRKVSFYYITINRSQFQDNPSYCESGRVKRTLNHNLTKNNFQLILDFSGFDKMIVIRRVTSASNSELYDKLGIDKQNQQSALYLVENSDDGLKPLQTLENFLAQQTNDHVINEGKETNTPTQSSLSRYHNWSLFKSMTAF
jgi:hypothetical protein